jgi:arylformamidase
MKPMNRREFLRLSAAAGAVGGLFPMLPAWAQMPPPEGPIVWGGLTQNQLDAAYDQNFWDNDPPETGQRSTANGDKVRALYGEPERIQYGPSQFEFLDLYRTKVRRAPIMVFIHGGAWRGGSARGAAQNAEMFMLAGAHFISLDFINVLQTVPSGNLMEMAAQVRRGVAWAYRNAHHFDGDRRRLFISGHSSGGHLGGCVMTTDWSTLGLPWDTVKGGVLISGMYELEPVALSARRLYVNFTPETVQELSAQRHLNRLRAPIVVAHGTKESPEFQRQSRDFVAAVRAAGKPVEYAIGTGYNHFEIPETMGSPYGVVGRPALALMDLPVTAELKRGRRDDDDDDDD